jgi:hypothetical protein
MNTAVTDDKPPPKSADRQLNLKNQSLQGIGAIASVLAAIAAFVVVPASCRGPQESPATTPSSIVTSGAAGNVAVDNGGDCNIVVVQGQAADVQANCAPAARNIATGNYGSPRWLFEGSPEQLTTPPDYVVEDSGYHCGRWQEWLDRNRLYAGLLSASIYLEAGQGDLVSIKNLEVRVTGRRPVGRLTEVTCAHTGDSDTGHYALVSTTGRTTHIYAREDPAHELADLGSMPPTLVYVRGNKASLLSINIDSQPGYLYEGFVVATVVKNGTESTLTIGSVARPLRWAGAALKTPFHLVARTPATEVGLYGWSVAEHAWIKDYSPFGR